jgi:hypothetical protein
MWSRRQFLIRGTGAALGISAGGLVWRALAQDETNQARGMINAAAQEAINTGLVYLSQSQNQGDGSFGTGQWTGNVAITSLAGLAFMAGGHQPGRGQYGHIVTRCVESILNNVDNNHQVRGTFLNNTRSGGHGPMYGHGFATLFLAEVYGMVNEPRLRERLRETLHGAVQLIINSQNQEGGWRYRPGDGQADISVTICQIMALRAARNAGIAVPASTARRCEEYVRACQDLHNTGGFRYQRAGGPPGFARTAAGVVALYSAGIYDQRDEAISKGLDYMMRFRPGTNQGGFLPNLAEQFHWFYGHYYAVQAMWIRGGDYWRQWYPAIRNELLGMRQNNGSWSMGMMCPHYCTAMALIILQVPNNYLPIMQR